MTKEKEMTKSKIKIENNKKKKTRIDTKIDK